MDDLVLIVLAVLCLSAWGVGLYFMLRRPRLPTLRGEHLRRTGAYFGLEQLPGESESAFRDRILAVCRFGPGRGQEGD